MDQQQAYEVLGSDQECEPGLRNRYYMGKRMTPSTFQVEQDYQVGRRRLLNRAIHGWGVAHGFAVARAGAGLTVEPGVALDQGGHELVQVGTRYLSPHDAFVPHEHHDALHKEHDKWCWLLSAHYAERREVAVGGGDSDCAPEEWEYMRETVAYSLRPIDCKECEAAPKLGERYCECADDGSHPGTTGDRGPHHCLCHVLGHRQDAGEGELCKMGRGLRVDVHHAVPLACVTLKKRDGCDELEFGDLKDACAVRRLVIGNEMLYELIRGRDLTRIEWLSWQNFHTHMPVAWGKFADLFPNSINGVTGLKIRFSGPVRKDTLKADCISIRVTVRDDRSGWGETLCMPLCNPRYDERTHEATLLVDPDWLRDEIDSSKSVFTDPSLVEIEVRGDFILDACGQAVDANAIGRELPSGNGTPGGTFLSSFHVEPRAPGYIRPAPVLQINEKPGDQP